jgi:hypothetical protein
MGGLVEALFELGGNRERSHETARRPSLSDSFLKTEQLSHQRIPEWTVEQHLDDQRALA